MKITRILMTAAMLAACPPVAAATAPLAWQNKALSADARADLLVSAMTIDEKLVLVTSYYGTQVDRNRYRNPDARRQSAGFVPGVPRLHFTPQWQTDAGSGVATQGVAIELHRLAGVVLEAQVGVQDGRHQGLLRSWSASVCDFGH